MLQPYLLQIDLELFGNQHRDRGVGALPHFDIGHCQDDLAVAADPNEGVRHERLDFSRFAVAAGKR